ncbi:MAG: NAD-dependent epimerase/dehydratase family protein [Rhodothermales bacterium]
MTEEARPAVIHTDAERDEVLTRPSPALKTFINTLHGPLVVLGAGGKMGPTLCGLARRAADEAGHNLDVIAISRFSNPATRAWLDARGIRTMACDLMDRDALRTLPDAAQVFYLVGLKFGTQQHPARTWAVNTLIPAYVTERYAHARIVALSTGNVYPLVPIHSGGSVETDALTPHGEYANACVARERIFEYAAGQHATPMVLVRLNYAVDLRYGVLVDIAQRIASGQPVDVTMGYLNCIWQGDANEMILRALALAETPPRPLNLTGPAVLSVRALAHRLGTLMGRPAHIVGTEAETALLSNPARACALLGEPPTPIDTLLRWTAHWIQNGGSTLDKPTHFGTRDGVY